MHHKRHHYSFHKFLEDTSHGISTIEKPIAHTIDGGIKSIERVDMAIIKGTKGVLNNVSMPLIIVGGIVVFAVLTQRR